MNEETKEHLIEIKAIDRFPKALQLVWHTLKKINGGEPVLKDGNWSLPGNCKIPVKHFKI